MNDNVVSLSVLPSPFICGFQCTWQENGAQDERRDEVPQNDSFSSFLSVSSNEDFEDAQANEEESEGGSQLQVMNQVH